MHHEGIRKTTHIMVFLKKSSIIFTGFFPRKSSVMPSGNDFLNYLQINGLSEVPSSLHRWFSLSYYSERVAPIFPVNFIDCNKRMDSLDCIVRQHLCRPPLRTAISNSASRPLNPFGLRGVPVGNMKEIYRRTMNFMP